MKKTLALAALLFTTSLTPVEAAPIAAVIGAIAGAIGVSTATVALVAINLTASVVMSAVQRARMKKAGQQNPGIRTERKLTGGVNSRSIILGRYATAGAEVCPPYSRGNSGKTPNIFLTYIISLADVPSDSINRIIVNGEYVPITSTISPNHGNQLGGKYAPGAVDKDPSLCFAWVKFYDGTQTTADPKLVEFFSSDPDRPWTANHVGRGVAYAIVTFRYQTDLFKGEPEVRFELNGAKLYDPRKDSSRGGSGTQRAATPSTWAFTQNPVVMAYNVLMGIPLGDGRIYGAGVPLEDLPLTEWVTAMNICDEPVNTPNGPEARYRAGLEIRVAEDEPADIIDDLMLACMGEVVEIGGVWKVRAGGPGLPVMFVEDGDFLVSKPSDFDPFPPSNASRNTVNVTYPHPEELWQPHDAPSVTKQEYLDRDGEPIVNEITLNSVPFPRQAQRLANAWLKDDQRWRSHISTFGPYAMHLEPLDVIQWNSTRNFYTNKRFEITATEEDLLNLLVDVGMRETDPSDYDPPSVYLPDPIVAGGWKLPNTQAVPGFSVSPYAVTDAEGIARRVAIRCVWDIEGAEDARSLNISVRRKGSAQEIDKSVTRVYRGTVDISEGILPNTEYEVRAIYDVDRPVVHTSWLSVVTGDAKLDVSRDDLAQDILDEFNETAKKAGITPVDVLPAAGDPNQIVMLIPPGRLYRWDDELNLWSDKLYAGIPNGYLDETKFAQGIEPNKIIPAGQPLPTVKSTNNIVWNGALYTWNGTEYTTPSFSLTPGIVLETHLASNAVTVNKILNSSVSAVKLATGAVTLDKILNGAVTELKLANGAVTDAKIAGMSASKLAGEITTTQISDSAVTTPKVVAGAIQTAQLATNAVTAVKVVAGAVTTDKLAADAVTASKIAALAIAAESIQAGAIGAVAIAALAVTTDKIAANAVTAGKIESDSIETRHIVAGAVTAAIIRAGAVGADQIAAGAVSARHVSIGSFENLFNGYHSQPLSPFVPDGWAGNWTNTAGFAGQPSIVVPTIAGAGGSGIAYRTRTIAVNPGDEYYIAFRAARNADWNGVAENSKIRIGDQSGNYIAAVDFAAANIPHFTVGYALRELFLTVPNGTSSLNISLVTDATAGQAYLSAMQMRLRNAGELMVDGIITSNKIAAGAVTANAIAAGAIVASHIAAGAVVASKIDVTNLAAISANLGIITSGTIRSGTSGERFQLDTINGLRIWDSSGNLRIILGKIS